MSYINPPYEDGFKELCAAMPLFYLDVYEMREILKAEGYLLDGLREKTELVIDNNFILLADEETVRKWEEALSIEHSEPLTLDQRKAVIMGYVCGYGHIGEPEIREVVSYYTPRKVGVDFAKGVIYLDIEGEVVGADNLLDTLLRRIPAHLRLRITLHTHHTYRMEIPFWQGGIILDRGAGGIPVPHRSGTVDVIFSQGGAAISSLDGGDTETPHETFRGGLKVFQGLLAESLVPGDAPAPSETSTLPLSFSQLAYSKPSEYSDTPRVKHASKSLRNGVAGVYCHSHIKSKFIE